MALLHPHVRPSISFAPVTWRLSAGAAPAAVRSCPRCDDRCRFVSSGRFRVNASGRRLDVWLIYRCERCDFTWNRTVHERTTPAALGALLPRFERNDPALAQKLACDVASLAREGVHIDGSPDVTVDRPPLAIPTPALEITLVVVPGCEARLDRVLARELGVSRDALPTRVIAIEPGDHRALRRPARDGTRIRIAGASG